MVCVRIFSTLAANDDGRSVSLHALSTASKLDAGVVEDILDYVCVQGMVAEVARGQYMATKLTHTLLVPVFIDAVTHFQYVSVNLENSVLLFM